jgi:hypothetical protein
MSHRELFYGYLCIDVDIDINIDTGIGQLDAAEERI